MLKPGRAPDYRDRDNFKPVGAQVARRVEPTRFEILTGIVRRFIGDRDRARAALQEIHDQKLYKEKYGTFENYCRDELRIGRAHAYRLLEAENVRESVEMSPLETEKINENAARALKSAPPEQRGEVIREVAQSGRVTGRRITEAVAKRRQEPVVIDVEPAPPTKTAEKHCPTCRCLGGREEGG